MTATAMAFLRLSLLSCLLALALPAQVAPAARLGPPALPAKKAPAQQFRELLAASPAERAEYLARKAPKSRELIEAKLREFAALSPEQRELRLRVAQLQFYLSPLLALEPAARSNLLVNVPAEDRPLIEQRLRAWDALPAEARRDLQDSERQLSYFVRLETTNAAQLAAVVQQAPAAAQPEVEAQLQRWLALSPTERARKTAAFQGFFELTDAERERTLKHLSSTDRTQMEQTLAAFEQLPPDQREQCVRAFRQFASLSANARAEFLRNAEKWQSLSADQRAAWRRIVQRTMNQPPLPGDPGSNAKTLLVATNSVGQ